MNFKLGMLMLFIFFLNICAVAQTNKDTRKKKQQAENKKEQTVQRSNSYRPQIPEEKQSLRKNKKSRKKDKASFTALFNKRLDDKVDQFYQRLEDNAKRNRKIDRKMDHPKYSDFSYFGHKKKPKIRPVGKRKLCKECGIVH